MTAERKKRVNLTKDQKIEIASKRKQGMSISSLCEEYDVARVTVSKIVNDPRYTIVTNENEEETKKEEGGSTFVIGVKLPDRDKVEERKMKRQQYKNSKKSKNRHQMKQERNKYLGQLYNQGIEEYEDQKQEGVIEEVLKETTNYSNIDSLDFGNCVYQLEDLNLTQIKQISKTVEAGLVADRHYIDDVDKYIYDEIDPNDLMFDYDRQYEIAYDFIKNNVSPEQTLVLYCTGLQSPLVSVVRACNELKINLVCKHYNAADKTYKSQLAAQFDYNIERTFPFTRLMKKGNIYMYDCTYTDVINHGNKFVTISINEHDTDYNNTFIDSSYIIILDESKMWQVYSQYYEMIKDESNANKRLSVMMAYMTIKDDSTIWGDNICKSYNFK